jgi:ABC-2 type transport system ATP-binding protein
MASEVPMDVILKVDGLVKSFGPKRVLDGLSFSLERGRVYGLLGRNGEGKTTLIRILLGIIPADAGAILYNGRPVTFSRSAYKAGIGYIPEDPFFYEGMTVRSFLDFNRAFYARWNAAKAASTLKDFSLDPRARIRELSRGMKLKLELVTALGAEPDLLVLDDPTSGLDVPTRQDFLRDIVRELAAAGTTVFFATHLVHELERIVERLGILRGGRLILDEDFGTVKESTRRVSLSFEGEPRGALKIPGTIVERRDGKHTETVIYPWGPEAEARLARLNPVRKDIQPMSLEDIFVSFVAGD